jgi:hypothetical protein
VIPGPLLPLDTEPLTGVGEELADAIGPVRELLARIDVVLALDVDAIEASPPVCMDEPSQEWLRLGIHNLLLPASQLDPPVVLSAGPCCGT